MWTGRELNPRHMDFQTDPMSKFYRNQKEFNTFFTISSATVSTLLADDLCTTVIYFQKNVKSKMNNFV
jgi:hypothetical protein